MANKRQIKKAIKNACGDIAGECIFAESAFGEGKIEEWDSIIVDTALLQQEANHQWHRVPSHSFVQIVFLLAIQIMALDIP